MTFGDKNTRNGIIEKPSKFLRVEAAQPQRVGYNID